MNRTQQLYALAFGAHPDDVEAGAGGLVYKWNTSGKPTGIVDITRGESATNGNRKERAYEAEKARDMLHAPIRENLEIPDGQICLDPEHIRKTVDIIRKYQPEIIIAPYGQDRHMDHCEANRLVMKAAFQAGLRKYESDLPAHRPRAIMFYMLHFEFTPSFIVDISQEHKFKMQSLRIHESQFGKHEHSHETYINNGDFIGFLETRAKFYGHKVGVQHGEPYALYEPFIGISDPSELLIKGI